MAAERAGARESRNPGNWTDTGLPHFSL